MNNGTEPNDIDDDQIDEDEEIEETEQESEDKNLDENSEDTTGNSQVPSKGFLSPDLLLFNFHLLISNEWFQLK